MLLRHRLRSKNGARLVSKYAEIKAGWSTIKEIVDPLNRHIRVPPAKRYHFFGKEIKDDGSLPYRKEYLNEDPLYKRDMKLQSAEQSLLGVAAEIAEKLTTVSRFLGCGEDS